MRPGGKGARANLRAAGAGEDQIDGANITQATVAFGVATEKAMLLSGEIGGGVPLQINMYPGVAELLHKRYFEMLAALPNDETFSEPRAAMESPSRKELPKSE